MARAPFQVAIFPFRKMSAGHLEYAIFRRSVEGYWQSIAGGGEGAEASLEAAIRETWEEAGLPTTGRFVSLQTVASAPVIHFSARQHWDTTLLVIPIFFFGVDAQGAEIRLSREHTEYQWLCFAEAHHNLKWDSDKTALWELDQRLLFASQ